MISYFKDEFTFLSEFKDRIEKRYVVTLENASTRQKYNVLGEMVSEVIAENWMETKNVLSENNLKEAYLRPMAFLV